MTSRQELIVESGRHLSSAECGSAAGAWLTLAAALAIAVFIFG